MFDSKHSFTSHVNEVVMKARRGIGMIRYLSQSVSRNVLNQMYKLHVRHNLDYGDLIFRGYDPQFSSVLTRRLEQV